MSRIKTIILVHGFWADASCYREVIPRLRSTGYEVMAVQNPLTSLQDDIAATQRVLNRLNQPCILVGHSWGGFVITEVGLDPRVVGLVYLAGLAPDIDESMLDLMSRYGQPSPHFQEEDGFIWISPQGIKEVLAQDLSDQQQALLYATQTPPAAPLTTAKAKQPAWHHKPSWYLVTQADQAMPPPLQAELAQRMKAQTMMVNSGHFPMLSYPMTVVDIIDAAVLNS
ncbi:alpha/beta fold hydrolase [Synechococcus sp. PCC 6312]|uniref:alpha/beta fold hydrolase n=1 Tax=Synechococcus sp. (strain ATCC 27167 / PCC 6312) TaxID=195253 RepID=UPI00059CAC2F|nr:alpha/beta hydrolase [Synechococcus sp. PCC 6312]